MAFRGKILPRTSELARAGLADRRNSNDPLHVNPVFAAASPVFAAASPVFAAASPVFATASPVFATASPVFATARKYYFARVE